MGTNGVVAAINCGLTSITIACAVLGYVAIRRQEVARHRRLMLLALAASALFMVGFVARYIRFGRTEFVGGRLMRVVYSCVWYSHEPVAFVSVPLVVSAAALALGGSFQAHRDVARYALAAWIYAAVTGVALYALLYVR